MLILLQFFKKVIRQTKVTIGLLVVGFNEPFTDFPSNDTTIENVTGENILGIVIDNQRKKW